MKRIQLLAYLQNQALAWVLRENPTTEEMLLLFSSEDFLEASPKLYIFHDSYEAVLVCMCQRINQIEPANTVRKLTLV